MVSSGRRSFVSDNDVSRSDETVEIVDEVAGRFYELRVNGEFAGLVVYEPFGSRRVLTHTTIQPEFRGRGLSWRMMSGVLDDLQDKGMTMTNTCPIVDRFIQKNPQYAGLLDADRPGTWPERRPAGD
jgi:uncharacterized protein